MKIRTKINVDYNNGIKAQENGIIEGVINSASWLDDFNTIGVNYKYVKVDGTVIHQNGFTISGEQIEVLWNTVKTNIPEGLNYKETNSFSFYLGFIYEMANTFSIEVSDIEIVY